MRDAGGGSQGLTSNIMSSNGEKGRGMPAISNGRMAAVRSRLRSGEVSERKQVGDTESMINEEPSAMQPGGSSQWLE